MSIHQLTRGKTRVGPLTVPSLALGTPLAVSYLHETAIRYAEVTVTNAEIKALRAAPKTLVAAPGAGKIIELVSALLFLDYGSNGLTESADNLAIYYAGETVSVSTVIECTGFIDQTADTLIEALPTTAAAKTATATVNKALTLKNTGDGEFAGNAAADTVLRVKVAYRVHTTGW